MNKEDIYNYIHCKNCISKIPPGISPREFAKTSIGMVKNGLIFWCDRCNEKILFIEHEWKENLPCECEKCKKEFQK